MIDLEPFRRVRYVTPRRKELQGLRYLPMSALMLLIALVGSHPSPAVAHGPLGPSTQAGQTFGIVVDGVLLFVLPLLMDRWYDRVYGPAPALDPLDPLYLREAGILTFLLAGSFTIQNIVHLPAPIFLLSIALVLWVVWPPEGTIRRQYRRLCVPIALVAALGIAPIEPLYGVLRAGPDFAGSTASFLALSLIGFVGGVLDHRLLITTLHRRPKEHHEATI